MSKPLTPEVQPLGNFRSLADMNSRLILSGFFKWYKGKVRSYISLSVTCTNFKENQVQNFTVYLVNGRNSSKQLALCLGSRFTCQNNLNFILNKDFFRLSIDLLLVSQTRRDNLKTNEQTCMIDRMTFVE